jgi:small-conductance mechanosensitive channel
VKHTKNTVDDAVVESLGRTLKLTLLVIGLAVAAQTLDLPAGTNLILHRVLVVVLILQTGLWIGHTVTRWLEHYRERQLEDDRGAATAVGAISFVAQVTIWTVVILAILSNLNVNITAMITGLGIGGIAVALALQNVFSDLFASLSIVFDKPFVIGDFIIVGEHLGSVEHVGLKTTRVRSLSGEQLVFANSDLLTSRIRNFGRMYERRVVFQLGVTYQTLQERLVEIPGIIREAIEEQENTRFDRSNFAKYGDFALNFETVYYVLAPDYSLYMNIQEKINLKIRERFLAEEIEFAYPTQTLFLQREEG